MKDSLRILLAVMMFCFWSCSSEGEDIPEPTPPPTPEVDNHEAIERAALIEFYQATGGDNWTNKTNWCSDEPVNEWYGITCTGDYITEINLDSNNLTGSIPECIGNLSKLKVLKMPSNQLTGSIPDSIWNLTKLESLDLGWNQLTGSIPESIGNLTKLKYLKLGLNQLTGSIPESIGNLTDLRDLVLRENQFSGSIPESIGKLSKMAYIDFDRNQFTGSIPECIGNLTALFSLDLAFNQFTGNIPASIGKLTELWWLMLRDNQLTGSIPESIGNLGNLEVINFMNNSLSGKIPESVTKLEAWKYYWHIVIQGNPELDLEGVYIPGPVFSITDIDGNQIVSRTEYKKNKLTILYFWGTWCPASNAFNPTLVHLYNVYHKYGMEIIGYCIPKQDSKDSMEETMSYLKKRTTPWRNAIESEGNMINIFNEHPYLPCIIAVNDNKEVIFQSFTEDYGLLTDVVHKYFESTTDE